MEDLFILTNMKKKLYLIFLIAFCCQNSSAQNANHFGGGGDFTKTVEYNILIPGATEDLHIYNLDSKSDLDKIFFGYENSFVEYVFNSGIMREPSAGLRIRYEKSKKSYLLEIFLLPNSNEKLRNVSEKLKKIDIPEIVKFKNFISYEGQKWIEDYNKKISPGDIYSQYREEPKSFEISNSFAEKLHAATNSLIRDFKAEGIPAIIFDGYSTTFRCVVGSELWTLKIHEPQNEALQLSDMFRQIVSDSVDSKKLDESKYMEILENIDL